MFMPTAVAVNTNLQPEHVVLLTAQADKFYITLADLNLLIMVRLRANQGLSISMFHSKYGAWALNSKTGIAGGALEMDSLEAAKREAIKTCEQGGQNKPCKVLVWVRNGCIAVAQGKDSKSWRNFFGTTPPGMAEIEALRKCQEHGLSQCKVVVNEACSLPKF